MRETEEICFQYVLEACHPLLNLKQDAQSGAWHDYARPIFKRAKFFVCWVVTVLAKATVWVLAIVVRWVSRVVCTVQIVIGVLHGSIRRRKSVQRSHRRHRDRCAAEEAETDTSRTTAALPYLSRFTRLRCDSNRRRERRFTRHFGPGDYDGLDDIYADPDPRSLVRARVAVSI
jgi:hypothetical protein